MAATTPSSPATATSLSEDEQPFCHDLPTVPLADAGWVLVTGASGYIGGRLVPELLARGYRVRVMVRTPSQAYAALWPGVEVVVADALRPGRLLKALEGVDIAYYLIHSLLLGPEEFEAADIQAAANFRRAAEAKRLRRIIYLGGLGDLHSPLSSHLRNRLEVAAELRRGKVPVTILRAAIIIGSGNAPYEILEYLVRNLHIFLMPRWSLSRCQPIGIRDVIKYLVGVLELTVTAGQAFDIGGKDILTYQQMVKVMAVLMRRRKIYLTVPFSNIKFYAYFASLYTPVPALLVRCLMESLQNDVVCQEDAIKRYLPFTPLSYREAVIRAMRREEHDRVDTRWSDSYPRGHDLVPKLHQLRRPPRYTISYSLTSDKSAAALFRSVCRIGGEEGWYHYDWMFRVRGRFDRLLLGVGSSRGRRSRFRLKINDVIDFWRVEDLQPEQRLLLRAEMKLPGRGWLEFNIAESDGARKLTVTAYFHTTTLVGRLYWHLFLPFHYFIFKDLIQQIERRPEGPSSSGAAV